MITIIKKIKETNRCTNPAILALEQQVQIVITHVPHLYARCFQFKLRLKALMITDRIPILWITINPTDLQYLFVICLARVELDLESDVAPVFARKTAIINPVTMAKFFDIICKAVLLSLFANEHHDGGLLGPVSTYFKIVKTNDCGMLYLHCLV